VPWRGAVEGLGFLVSAEPGGPGSYGSQKAEYEHRDARERAYTAGADHKTAKPVAPAASEVPMATTTERAALPPLEVEVVAGNRHINVPAKSNAIHVDVDTGATSSAANAPGSATGTTTAAAGGRVELSPQTTQRLAVSVAPDYPLLARQMKVQGAVSLQTLISRRARSKRSRFLVVRPFWRRPRARP